jgi:hypothetical protein
VSIDGSGDGSERIHVSRNANQVGNNVPNDGQHGSAAVAEFGFAEEWDERRVSFGKFQLKYSGGALRMFVSYETRVDVDFVDFEGMRSQL